MLFGSFGFSCGYNPRRATERCFLLGSAEKGGTRNENPLETILGACSRDFFLYPHNLPSGSVAKFRDDGLSGILAVLRNLRKK